MPRTMTLPTTEIYLIRHGETTLSQTRQYIGSTDVLLSEQGKEQAERLAERLRSLSFEACYCSIMTRCQQTACIVAASHKLAVTPLAELREIDYGDWETLTPPEMQRLAPDVYRAWQRDPGRTRAPHGESGADVLQRVQPVLHRLAAQHQGQRVLLIAHKTVNRLWLCDLLGHDISTYRHAIGQDFTALNIVEYTGDSEDMRTQKHPNNRFFVVKQVNDTSHLPSASG